MNTAEKRLEDALKALKDGSVEEISLWNKHIGDEGVKKIAFELETNSSVTWVNLEGMYFKVLR